MLLALPLLACAELEPSSGQSGTGEPAESAFPEPGTGHPGPHAESDTTPSPTTSQVLTTPPAPAPTIVQGTGRFINRAAASQTKARITKSGDVSLNFVGASVQEFVRSVLGQTLKLNFTIDPAVKGTITVQTSRPIAMKDVLATLESVLRLNGVAVVASNGIYNVVPVEKAVRGLTVPRLPHRHAASAEAYGVQIVPLKHTSASAMAKILEPFAPKDAILRTDDDRNLLLLAGTHDERSTMTEIVEIFDVDWLAGMSFALVPLRFSEAKSIIADLEKIFGSASGEAAAGPVRFMPIERMNAVLAISTRPSYLKRAKEWIDKFDIGSASKDRRLFVYRVQNGRATDLAKVLSQIFGGTLDIAGERKEGRLAPGLEPARLSSRAPTEPHGSMPSAAPAKEPDQQATPRSHQVVKGETVYAISRKYNVTVAELARINGISPPYTITPGQTLRVPATGEFSRVGTSARLSAAKASSALGREDGALNGHEEIRIIADDTNNSLVILATGGQYRDIEAALRQLDTTPLQVMIEATIAEVRLKDQLKYGVKWFFDEGNTSVTLSDLPSGAVNSTFPGFSVLFSSSDKVRVVLDALDQVTDLNVISSPQLLVLDNRTAELQVGDQVPVATQSSVSSINPDAPIVNSISFRDTGVLLRVTPRVNASGLVNLEIEQEVSDVAETTTSGIDSPTIQQRRIKSWVAVQSGETVALGGLIRKKRSNSTEGLPLLSRIPILGALFGTHENDKERTELLVLMTPRVIRNAQEARDITTELRRRIKSLAPKKR